MATVTGYTAARMDTMEAATVITGKITGDNLILTTKGGTNINAGNVRGPQGDQGDQGPGPNPTGTFIIGGWTTDPSGYLILDGRLIAGGVGTYPALSAVFPGWKSGANLQLPNATGAVPMVGGATPGVVSGAMTHNLITANVPGHSHGVNDHQHATPNHAHAMSHGHTGSSSWVTHDHAHQIPNHQHAPSSPTYGEGYAYRHGQIGGGSELFRTTAGGILIEWHDGAQSTFSGGGGWTGGISQNHYHYITVDNMYGYTSTDGSGLSGGAPNLKTDNGNGGGTAVDHTPKNIAVRMAVKT